MAMPAGDFAHCASIWQLLDHDFVSGHDRHVLPILARLGFVEQQARVFVRDQSSQEPAHRREHLIQIQARDDGVVHLEQQLEPIALACQCLLCRSDAFVVQDVIDSDGYLIRRPAA